MLYYQNSSCPLICTLTKFVRSLYTLFFLSYTCDYNEHPIILDSDNKFEEIARHITLNESKASQKIYTQFEQNGIKVASIVSGIPISELSKWIQKDLLIEKQKFSIELQKNYYPLRDPIVTAIGRKPIINIKTNSFVDYITVLVEFIYTREQIKEIVHLFEQLFIQLTIRTGSCIISEHVIKLFQYYYLHFAIPYYASTDSDNTISILWDFPYTTYLSILRNWNKYTKMIVEDSKANEILPSIHTHIRQQLLGSLYPYIPPYVLPFIIQNILKQFKRRPVGTCKQFKKLAYKDEIYFGKMAWLYIIANIVLPKLKQIVDTHTDLTPMSLLTFCTPYEVIRYELAIRPLFTYYTYDDSYICQPFEHMIELLANRYGIDELVCTINKD